LFGIKINFYALTNLQLTHHLLRFNTRLVKKAYNKLRG
jgi:hypothetical protein